MPDTDDIDLKLKNLQNALAASRQALQSGEAVDLKGLDREVGSMCALVTLLGKPEGHHYLTALQDMVATLDLLAADLRRSMEVA